MALRVRPSSSPFGKFVYDFVGCADRSCPYGPLSRHKPACLIIGLENQHGSSPGPKITAYTQPYAGVLRSGFCWAASKWTYGHLSSEKSGDDLLLA